MVTQANKLAAPLCEAEGVELVHIEYQQETGGRILRLYIDKPGGGYTRRLCQRQPPAQRPFECKNRN